MRHYVLCMSSPELSVVVPVYDEEAAIGDFAREWTGELDRLGIDYELCLYDDGSRDGTAVALQSIANANPRVVVRGHSNRGHGPTVMRGYAEARGQWVFQTDSDREIPAAAFEALWRQRGDYDLLVGRRVGRPRSPGRFLLTFGSRTVVALAFGRAVHDVNSPYRLMRGSWLRERVLPLVPAATAVPNIALCGIASRSAARIMETNVPYVPRQSGTSSIDVKRAVHLAWRGVLETLRIMRAMRR